MRQLRVMRCAVACSCMKPLRRLLKASVDQDQVHTAPSTGQFDADTVTDLTLSDLKTHFYSFILYT